MDKNQLLSVLTIQIFKSGLSPNTSKKIDLHPDLKNRLVCEKKYVKS